MLEFYFFVLEESLRIAPRCRNMLHFATCHKLYSINCRCWLKYLFKNTHGIIQQIYFLFSEQKSLIIRLVLKTETKKNTVRSQE